MDDQWRMSKYDPAWRDRFEEVAARLRESLGDLAIRIDHVGSTSVTGLDAKPIVDIQISIVNYNDLANYQANVERCGFVLRENNPEKTKRYFRELAGTRRTHVHVRQAGGFSEQLTLLFRDYLREHPADCARYAAEKHRLMGLYQHDHPKYVEGKTPIVWDILQKAHLWSQEFGWKPGPSDM